MPHQELSMQEEYEIEHFRSFIDRRMVPPKIKAGWLAATRIHAREGKISREVVDTLLKCDPLIEDFVRNHAKPPPSIPDSPPAKLPKPRAR